MEEKADLTRELVQLLEIHFGSSVAKSYAQFYKEREDKEILASVGELLGEYIGEKKTAEALSPIINKHNIK